MIEDERGMIYTCLGLVMLPLALLVIFMLFDAARINLVRGQEMTMADAASLAAALTATPVSSYTYSYQYDGGGNIIGVQESAISTQAVIQDSVAAESAARQAALLNMGVLTNQKDAGMMSFNVSPSPGANDDLSFQLTGADSCVVKLKSTLATFAGSVLVNLYGQAGGDKN